MKIHKQSIVTRIKPELLRPDKFGKLYMYTKGVKDGTPSQRIFVERCQWLLLVLF